MVPAHRLTTSWPITIPPSGGIVRYARAFVMNDSWYRASVPAVPPRAQLQGVLDADVCIVGAGFTGLSAALELAEAGRVTSTCCSSG